MKRYGLVNTYSKIGLSKEQKILVSKFESDVTIYKTGEQKKCAICGKEIKGFCKSHSLPQFVLKKIANKGMVKTGKAFQSDSYVDKTGVGNSLTFYAICNKCDKEAFKNYEKEEALVGEVSDDAINEIAIKNYLRYLYKQKREFKKWGMILEEHDLDPELYQLCSNLFELSKMDIQDTEKKLQKYLHRKNSHNYYIIDEINLGYQTQLAYQGFITIVYGFDGLINNIYNYNSIYAMQQLGVCVFPHKHGTKILLFCEEGSTRLKYFYRKYRTLSLDQKLYVINYLLLLYEEEWVVNGDFEIKLNKETLLLINQRDTVTRLVGSNNTTVSDEKLINSLKPYFELKTSGNIYNFLKENKTKF